MQFVLGLALTALLVGCGGSSKNASPGNDGASGESSGASGGTSGSGGMAGGGGAGGSSASGGAGGTQGGTGAMGDPGVGGSAAAFPSIPEGGQMTCGDGGCLPIPEIPPLDPPGPVLCGGVPCEDNEICCLTTGLCFDPDTSAADCELPSQDDDPWGRPVCSSNADCGEFLFCQLDSEMLCQGPGHCHPIGNCGGCGDDGSGACKVCACDGNTYANFQTACLAGASVLPVNGGCGETVTVGGGGANGEGTKITLCATDAQCASGEACCSITRRCYPTSDPNQCTLPPEGTSFPCTSNEQCFPYEFCQGDGCESPGGCVSTFTEDCGVTFEPVCGCDGTTYTSVACATSKGVRVASDGECGAK